MSNASYSSDFLNEAPIIVTPSRTAVRQVLGVVKAEVISAGSSSADSLKLPASRPANKSPLASSSFGPDDVVPETDESRETRDPFEDKQYNHALRAASASPAAPSFRQGSPHSQRDSASSEWTPDQPRLPWNASHQPSSSVSTQGGSIIDIGSATRVNLSAVSSPTGLPRSPYRTTMARLVNPASLQEQQRRALAQAQTPAPGSNASKRTSGSSVVSAASRAYSILESFPFVPPSPISDRPIRSPPCSPQTQQSFTSNASSPLSQQTFNTTPPSPHGQSDRESHASADRMSDKEDDAQMPAPPNRRAFALSTVSTASSGLGSFPFQIETSLMADASTPPPVPVMGRQRASLDTLAITSDLTSYPLGFDRDSAQVPVPPLPKKN